MNSGENVGQETSHNEWADAMADVKPFSQNTQSEQSRQTKTEQEKGEGELIASIKRGYFEKSPEELRTETVERRNRATLYGDYQQSIYDQSIERYGSDVESCGVSVDDLISLACISTLDYVNMTGLNYYEKDNKEFEKKKEEVPEVLENIYQRYFSKEVPEDKRQTMSTIIKKLRFKRDLMDKFGLKRMGRKENESYYTEDGSRSFRADQLYSQPEERAGLPSEMRDYVFNLSDEEATLLAEADDDDLLADTLKRILPKTVQKTILNKMPDDKYKDTILKNIDHYQEESERLLAKAMVDERMMTEPTMKRRVSRAKDLYRHMPSYHNIVDNMEERSQVEGFADFIHHEFDVSMRANPVNVMGGGNGPMDSLLFGSLTEMDFYDINDWARK